VDTKRLVTGTLVGAITLSAVGYLFFGILFADFYAANVGSATGVNRDAWVVWSVAIGALAHGALLTLAIGTRAGTVTIGGGAMVAATVSFLAWAGVDFTFYGVMNLSNLAATIVDPLVELVHGGIAGGVIAAVLGRVAK